MLVGPVADKRRRRAQPFYRWWSRRSAQRLAEDQVMAVRRGYAELSHAPRFIGDVLKDHDAIVFVFVIELFDFCDIDIGEPGMIAEAGCGSRIGTVAQHALQRRPRQQRPGRAVAVEGHRVSEIVDREQATDLLHRRLLTASAYGPGSALNGEPGSLVSAPVSLSMAKAEIVPLPLSAT